MTIVVKHGEHSIKLSADNPDQAAKIIETFLSEHSVDREGIGE